MADDDRLNRNVTINGRRTTLRMEKAYWLLIEEICAREEVTISELCQQIERENWALKECSSLTSALRVFVATYFHAAATEQGHERAGHGSLEFSEHPARGD